jgi:hypothetical protein
MSTSEAMATHWARGGRQGLTDGSRRRHGRERLRRAGARSAVRRYLGWRHPRGGSTTGIGEGEVTHAGEMEGDGIRAALTEVRRSAAVL